VHPDASVVDGCDQFLGLPVHMQVEHEAAMARYCRFRHMFEKRLS